MLQAEKILEYGASCGKNIDRTLIMSVLHNEAYGYQRMWDLNKCSNYLEALIYNINAKFSAGDTPLLLTEANGDSNSCLTETGEFSEKSRDGKNLKKL